MVYEDLVDHFGTPSAAAKALGVDRRLVDCWKKRRIPTKHQLRAETESAGKLKLDAKATAEAAELAQIIHGAEDARAA